VDGVTVESTNILNLLEVGAWVAEVGTDIVIVGARLELDFVAVNVTGAWRGDCTVVEGIRLVVETVVGNDVGVTITDEKVLAKAAPNAIEKIEITMSKGFNFNENEFINIFSFLIRTSF